MKRFGVRGPDDGDQPDRAGCRRHVRRPRDGIDAADDVTTRGEDGIVERREREAGILGSRDAIAHGFAREQLVRAV